MAGQAGIHVPAQIIAGMTFFLILCFSGSKKHLGSLELAIACFSKLRAPFTRKTAKKPKKTGFRPFLHPHNYISAPVSAPPGPLRPAPGVLSKGIGTSNLP
jgi:hypothetical protein